MTRNNRRISRRIRNARFRYKANVEQIDFEVDRNLDSSSRAALMEIMEDRHGKHSTIITSQLPVRQWHEVIGERRVVNLLRKSHGQFVRFMQSLSFSFFFSAVSCSSGFSFFVSANF